MSVANLKLIFLLCFLPNRENATAVDAPVRPEQQPITAEDPEMNLIVAPPARPDAPMVEKSEAPKVEPATTQEDPPKPDQERTSSPVLQPEPGQATEPVLQPPGKQQEEEADEEKPAAGLAGGQESLVNSEQPPVCEAEQQLWAAVEETAAENSVSTENKQEDADGKDEEGGVTGG